MDHRITDRAGREVRYHYSGAQLTRVTDVLGHDWTYAYTGNLLTGISDPQGHTTSVAYNGNRAVRVTDALGHATQINGVRVIDSLSSPSLNTGHAFAQGSGQGDDVRTQQRRSSRGINPAESATKGAGQSGGGSVTVGWRQAAPQRCSQRSRFRRSSN